MAKRTTSTKAKRKAGLSIAGATARGARVGQQKQRDKQTRRAPADVAPKAAAKSKAYTWTPELDQALRERYSGQRNGAGSVAVIADAFGFPFHVVKRRVKELGLTKTPAKTPRARRTKRPEDTPASPTPAVEQQLQGAATGATAARIRHAICPNRPACYTRAQFDPTDSLEELHAQGFIYGLDPDTQYPICANCRTTMVAAEPVEAPEAIRQAVAAGGSHQPRLWADPPFNFEGAYMELEEKTDEVIALKEIAENAQRTAKKAQKAYAKAQNEKLAMEIALKERRQQKAREARIQIDRAEEREELVSSDCIFEAHTKKPCRVCRAESPSLVAAVLQATNGALSDIASEAHRTLAIQANSRKAIDVAEKIRDAGLVVAALALRGLFGIGREVVETWDDTQRRAALTWVDGGLDRTHVSDVLGYPHTAADPGEDEQHCRDCGARILQIKSADGDPYPTGAAVGQFCTGPEIAAPAPAAPETTAAHA